jgi:hypothetical protein
MGKFNLTSLKKELKNKTKEELINEVATLYKSFQQVKDYYNAKNDDPRDVFEKYKNIIEKEFVYGKTRGYPKSRISVAKKAITDFKKLSPNLCLLGELMLVYTDSVSGFCSDFGVDVENYYTSSEAMFKDALELLERIRELERYQDMARNIVNNATDGWGHYDDLKDTYDDFYET